MPCLASARISRYAPASMMAPHRHEAATFGLVVAGGYEERTRGRETRHGVGHLLVCPAFEEHAQVFSQHGTVQVLVHPTADAVAYLTDEVRVAEAPWFAGAREAALALRFHTELSLDDAFSPLVLEGLMLELLGGMSRAAAERGAPPWLAAARELIDTGALDEGGIDAVARAVGRHPVALARAFRRRFGVTPGECARQARVRRAASLLAAGRAPIAEIAAACGFCDQAHLTRSFKAVMGVTPAAYRAAVH